MRTFSHCARVSRSVPCTNSLSGATGGRPFHAGSCCETPNRGASGCSATASRRPFLLLPRSRLRIEPRGFARLVQRAFSILFGLRKQHDHLARHIHSQVNQQRFCLACWHAPASRNPRLHQVRRGKAHHHIQEQWQVWCLSVSGAVAAQAARRGLQPSMKGGAVAPSRRQRKTRLSTVQ